MSVPPCDACSQTRRLGSVVSLSLIILLVAASGSATDAYTESWFT